jgi:hypothetical protein
MEVAENVLLINIIQIDLDAALFWWQILVQLKETFPSIFG